MIHTILRFSILVIFLSLVKVADAQDVYVAPNGSDSNPGTKEKPVATLEAARDLIRQYKATNEQPIPKGGITIWIGQGQYDQTKPFVLEL